MNHISKPDCSMSTIKCNNLLTKSVDCCNLRKLLLIMEQVKNSLTKIILVLQDAEMLNHVVVMHERILKPCPLGLFIQPINSLCLLFLECPTMNRNMMWILNWNNKVWHVPDNIHYDQIFFLLIMQLVQRRAQIIDVLVSAELRLWIWAFHNFSESCCHDWIKFIQKFICICLKIICFSGWVDNKQDFFFLFFKSYFWWEVIELL